MNWLFEQLRPKIDETALQDAANFSDDAPAPKPVRWRVVVLGLVILALGLLLLAGVVVIGIRVDWVLTATIPWRRTEIWAGAAMTFLCLSGLFLAYVGGSLIDAVRRRRTDAHRGRRPQA